jgi:TonB family protein
MSLRGSSQLSFVFLMACALKTTAVLSFTAIVVKVSRQRSAAFRHRLWATGILGSLILPLLSILLPAWRSQALGNVAGLWIPAHAISGGPGPQVVDPMIIDASVASRFFGSWASLVLLVWAGGFLFFAMRLGAGLGRLAWISANSKPLLQENWMHTLSELSNSFAISRQVQLLQCEHPAAIPLTWGNRRPLIILPSVAGEWSDDRRRIILAHELAHIGRRDWLLQVCAEVARAFYWFHPLVWVAAERLRQDSECACDDSVLNSGVQPFEYANHLLEIARCFRHSRSAWSAALGIARPSNLERRFVAMLTPSINRRGLSLQTRLVIALLAAGLVLPLAVLRLPAQNVSGKFSGIIKDASGTGVANATVVMAGKKTNAVEMTTSDAAGNFSFKTLPAGEYEMRVMKRGFDEYRAPQVLLEPGHDASQVVTLGIAAVTDEVDVVAEGKVKPLTPPGSPGKPARLRVGGEVEAAKRTNLVHPIYPEAARAAGIHGTVILHAVIGMNGTPLSLRVMNHEIDPDLARAAVEAVSQWRYRPTLLNGDPIEVDTMIKVNFTLQP